MSAAHDSGAGIGGDVVAPRWGRQVAVVARAVAPRPWLWWTAAGAVRRLARRGWWRRSPYLPLPGEAYWRFRVTTAYGSGGSAGPARQGSTLSVADVVAYLRWCQRSRPRSG
jgi:hypothetical protein